MKTRYLLFALIIVLAGASCKKTNDVSKIPQITLQSFAAGDGTEMMRVNVDTAFLFFTFTDGDADIGVDPGSNDIYIKDLRFGNFVGYNFPFDIDRSIENPKKGLAGSVIFQFTPDLLSIRTDSLHTAMKRDTTAFEFYIVDRAGNESNHLTTPAIIVYKP